MFKAVIKVGEGRSSVVRWVDVYTLDVAGELLFECFEGEKVVTEDEAVVEEVMVSHPVLRVIRLLCIFEQNARLQPRPILLPDPRQLQFLFY